MLDNANIECNFVAVVPPSLGSLEERMRKRGSESEESIRVRIADSEQEIAKCIDPNGIIQYKIVNNDIDVAK